MLNVKGEVRQSTSIERPRQAFCDHWSKLYNWRQRTFIRLDETLTQIWLKLSIQQTKSSESLVTIFKFRILKVNVRKRSGKAFWEVRTMRKGNLSSCKKLLKENFEKNWIGNCNIDRWESTSVRTSKIIRGSLPAPWLFQLKEINDP